MIPMKKFLLIPLMLCGALVMNAQPLSKLQKFGASATTEVVQKAQHPLVDVQQTSLQLPGKKTRASLDEYAVNAKQLTNNDLSLNIYYGGVGIANTMSVATYYSADIAARFAGNKMTSIYSALGQGVKEATFWIRKSLNGDNLWETTVTEFTPISIFEVDCDYTIDNEAFILGYTVKGDFAQGSIFYTENVGNLSMIVADASGSWSDFSGNGSAFFVCETEGDAGLVQNDLAITNISISDRAMAGETFNIVGQLTNFGAYPVTSFKTKAIVNGQEIVNEHEVDMVLHKGTIDFAIPTTAPAHAGCYHNDIQVIEVNGTTDGYPSDNAITTQLLALAESYPRKVVMEEFTGTWCGWCPRGMAGIECLQRDFSDDFIAIAVHGGDTFEPETYTPILNGVSGFPSALINRVVEADPYHGLTDANYGIKDLVEQVKALPTEAQIGLSSKLSADNNEIEVTSYSKFNIAIPDASAYMLSYVLLEDKLVGSQTNYYAKSMSSQTGITEADLSEELLTYYNKSDRFIATYNDVARGIYDPWGIQGSMSGAIQKGKAKAHTYTITVPSTVKKKENLSIVVLLMDVYTGEIIAAEKAKVGEEKLTAIDTVAKSEMNASISATEGAVIVSATHATAQIYTLDGKLLATQSVNGTATIPTNGWNGTVIVRVENGNDVVVKKVVL